jgi:hypothetical protein
MTAVKIFLIEPIIIFDISNVNKNDFTFFTFTTSISIKNPKPQQFTNFNKRKQIFATGQKKKR